MTRNAPAFELLILDCDGVVVDSEPITTRVLAEMLNELGVTISVEQVAHTFGGHTFTLELVLKRLGVSLPHQFIENYRDRTFAAIEAELKPVQGIETALDQIAIPYCIASNGPHEKMRKTLGVTSLLSRFEGRLFSSSDVEPITNNFINAPGGGVLVLNNLNGTRYGSTMSDGHYGEIDVSPESMQRLQAVLQALLLLFKWRGPRQHAPGA
jgi:Haloacid dehalogenase-like hydrolase